MRHRVAAEYGLYPTYVKEFHEVFADNEDHSEYGPMLQHMRVVDANGESHMDEDQWEAASMSTIHLFLMTVDSLLLSDIYLAFAFEKRSR